MSWKVILSSLKNSDMRKRFLAVLGMIFVFRVYAHIPVPLSDPQTLKQILDNVFNSQNTPQLFSFINVLSGGALANFSIMLVGLGAYTKAIPQLEALNKEGEFGRKKINQYTRMLTLPLAIMQSIGAIFLVRQSASSIGGLGDITANTSPIQWVLMVASLTGGAMILMWLGELITEKGIGNGISLIITVGIVSTLPQTAVKLFNGLIDQTNKMTIFGVQLPINRTSLFYTTILLSSVVILTVFIVKLNEAARRLTINYAKRVQGNRTYGGVTTMMPVKLITAGVVPIIFAVAFLSMPSFAGQLMTGSSSARLQSIGATLVQLFQTPSAQSFQQPGWQPFFYPVVYFVLVVMFTFFYTSIAFNSTEIAENLQKQGGFIEGVRAGKQTEKYLGYVVNRLTLFGAFALGFLAIVPIIGQIFLSEDIAFEGTSILILVSVSLETLRQIESRALMVTYDQYQQPDFFYDTDVPLDAATGARRLRFIPGRSKKDK